MDPVIVLGVASAAVQFVDFTGKLVAGTIKIYREERKGKPQHDGDQLKHITANLIDLNDQIQASLEKVKGQPLSVRDQEIARLCRDCNQTANKLISALNQLRSWTRSQFWNCFVQALATIWNEAEIDNLKRTLEGFRSQISMYILVSIR
jgi:hypothetical protein